MQEQDAKLYKNVAKILRTQRKEKDLKFTIFCYENDIATSSLNTIEKGETKIYFSNIARVVRALGLSFEEFGKLLDEEVKENDNDLIDSL
ncbi:MAG: helix-turn-helix transcriptional regulator [Candidatus Gastranaerophilales bacterium]|nr:helix-turn-helix transcriptional regulator [Candidatus Gastranaerophilales bacterium]